MTTLKDFITLHPSDWLEKLVETYKINVARDGDLVSLKYNQIESPMAEKVVQQCRGTVVHAPTGRILAHPYDKFWNHGETLAAPIDWATARVMDKLDGSLMILYWDPFVHHWRVASSGHPTAGGDFGSNGGTFHDAFWATFEATDMRLPWSKEACYMFELCSPANRIVVKYDSPRLILHGSRWVNDVPAQESAISVLADIARQHNWPIVDTHEVTSLDEAIAKAAELDPLQSEGFVVVDAHFNRVKIKSPRYVRLHQLRDRTTPRAIIEAWLSGEESEILTYFPEMGADFDRVLGPFGYVADRCVDCIKVWGDLPSRKDFALQVKDLPYSAVLFRMHSANMRTAEEATRVIRDMSLAALERLSEAMNDVNVAWKLGGS